MGNTLQGQTVLLFGGQKDIFPNPGIVLGIDANGNAQPFGIGTATAATNTLTSDNTAPADGDTVTIGGQTYIARTALTASTTQNEVLINTTSDAYLLNLIRAINGTGTPGTDYGSLTTRNVDVTAATSVTAHAFLVTAIVPGPSAIATTETSAHLAWTTPTLTGGAYGPLVISDTGAGGATAANQATQITAEQAIQAAVAKTATFTNIAAAASSTTTIPIGAFDIGILILTGTGTVAAVDWPVSTPLNIKGPLAVAVALVLANPGTARVTYST